MPPKPKGLKASKRSAPFDPSSLPSDPAPSTSSNSERTFPLDEDCLTLSDLFELRLTVLEILYPFPTDLTFAHLDPEKLDEARSFLRGILHGCAVLEQYVKQGEYGRVAERDEEGNRSDEKVEKRREEAGEEKLDALGLGEANEDYTEAMILYLQGWSLHHLGELFEDPKEEVKSAALKLGGGGANKKRKIDLNEPRTKREWLEAGHFKYKMIHDGLAQEWSEGEDEDLIMTLVGADFIRCKCSIGRCMIEAEERVEGLKVAHELDWAQSDRIESSNWGMGTSLDPYFDDGDAVLAQLRSWEECILFREEFPSDDREGWEHKLVESTQDLDITAFEGIVEALDNPDLDDGMEVENSGREKGEERKAQIQLWKWLKNVVVSDAKMAKFVMLEDALEANYRPEDEEEEEDEEDEESEVKELPMNAEDVKLVKRASQEAIAALRETITSFATLPASVAHPSGRDTQYRKLEEVLLISSALVNSSDKEATKQIEEEIEKVRKEGGLEESEAATETGEGGVGVEK
ncbi:hypothetical protein JCM5353_002176 [Sporobolomyces roseus]